MSERHENPISSAGKSLAAILPRDAINRRLCVHNDPCFFRQSLEVSGVIVRNGLNLQVGTSHLYK
jgi:hypothetical protein